MAIINCPECGAQVSDKASSCPQCGYRLHTSGVGNKRRVIIVVSLVVACVAALALVLVYRNNSMSPVPVVATDSADTSVLASSDTVVEKEVLEPLTINSLCFWDDENKVVTLRKGKAIDEALGKLGFTLVDEGEEFHSGDEMMEDWTEVRRLYTRIDGEKTMRVKIISLDKETDNIFIGPLTVSFPDAESRDSFLETAVKFHFNKKSTNVYSGPNEDCYWTGTDIRVKGNDVMLTERFEP